MIQNNNYTTNQFNLESCIDDEKIVPWFIRIPYEEGRLEPNEVMEYLEEYKEGKPISISLIFAILYTYQLDHKKLLSILNMKPSELHFAQTRYIPKKRREHISNTLEIPNKFCLLFTSLDIPELENCAKKFKNKHSDFYKE